MLNNDQIKIKALEILNLNENPITIGVLTKAGDFDIYNRFSSWTCDHFDFLKKSKECLLTGKPNPELVNIFVQNWSTDDIAFYKKLFTIVGKSVDSPLVTALANTILLTGFDYYSLIYLITQIVEKSDFGCTLLQDKIDEIKEESINLTTNLDNEIRNDILAQSEDSKTELAKIREKTDKSISEESKKTARRINAVWKIMSSKNLMIAGVVVIGVSGTYGSIKYNYDIGQNLQTLSPQYMEKLVEIVADNMENKKILKELPGPVRNRDLGFLALGGAATTIVHIFAKHLLRRLFRM